MGVQRPHQLRVPRGQIPPCALPRRGRQGPPQAPCALLSEENPSLYFTSLPFSPHFSLSLLSWGSPNCATCSPTGDTRP